MPPMGGMRGGYLTEEEKENRPKVTFALLKESFRIYCLTGSRWSLY